MAVTADPCRGDDGPDARRSLGKSALVRDLLGPAVAALLTLLAPLAAAEPGPPPDLLDTAVQASWTRLPLRDWAERATRIAGRPVIVDRRIDPTTLISLDSRGEPLRDVLGRVAEMADAAIDVLDSTIRIVPHSVANQASSAEAARKAALARLPAGIRRKLVAREPWAWSDAARPRNLVTDAARAADVAIVGIDTIPHDHFPAATLPSLSLAERLDLVLAHFDRRVEWAADGGVIVPMEKAAAGLAPANATRRPADARAGPRGRRQTVAVRDVFSLRVEAPFDQTLNAIAARLGLAVDLDRTSLAARGIAPEEIVRVDVQDVSRDELLDALAARLGLSWKIDGDRLRVFAEGIAHPTGPAAAEARTAEEIARLVAAKTGLPSVHMDRPAIDAALKAGGVSRETLDRLWHEVDRAVLPGMGSRLDGFLFLARDPEWLGFRDRFEEFLTLPRVDDMTPEVAAALVPYQGFVSLPGITSLTPDGAEAFEAFGADSWGAAIELPGVTALSAEAAAALARCRALVVLPSLRELSPAAAAALARNEGIGLVIGGLATLPDDVAAALADCRSLKGMLLPDLTALDSPPLARRLVRQEHVFLPRVTTLSRPIADALRGSDSGSLALPALEQLTTEAAERLAGSGYYGITLGCAATLTPEAAAALAKQTGPLIFSGSAPFSAAAARELAAHPGDLVLSHVATLPADVTNALAEHEHLLVLEGVTAIDAATARGLAAHRGGVCLPALSRISAAALEILRERTDIEMPTVEDLNLVPEPAGGSDDVADPPR
ncbi:MAG: hypothetical protein K8S94_05995 [Planctomycetia bacterium]|nr:hypothetical protein [Planctomycetia bacterium]